MKISTGYLSIFLFILTTSACQQDTASMEDAIDVVVEDAQDIVMSDAKVYFTSPKDGDTIATTSKFVMGFEGVKIVTAGVMDEGTGHFHILINTDFVEPGVVVPTDDQHKHYGTAATEAELTLPVGTHTIKLQLGDGAHRGLEGEGYRDEITVTVE